ncbi:non-classical arabinogalactan protein 30-like [Gastrolobium bilobum]|uniref:non-classical arabinogalactan protein 30-like n=1 Tax=Gastrolobium bilobum TaxID=150636 RepID=UPI002AB09F90|nr:non-classical arabinogalactan protein 30-like [Gastrolobium bilobum]
MAGKSFIILFVLLLVVAFPNIEAGEDAPKITEKKVDVVVEAMVYCQSCEHFGTWSLTGAKPIPSAKVSVTCKNNKGHVSYYKVFDTDKNGYLYAPLEGFKMQNYILDHPLQSCYVKLVWSPLESCSLLSNVNYALNGAPLRYENKKLHGSIYEAVIYAAGPLAFRPSDCSHINTTHN